MLANAFSPSLGTQMFFSINFTVVSYTRVFFETGSPYVETLPFLELTI